jgi:hypothetical protein
VSREGLLYAGEILAAVGLFAQHDGVLNVVHDP